MDKYYEDGMYVITSKGSSESSSESKPSLKKTHGGKQGFFKIVEDFESVEDDSHRSIFNSNESKKTPSGSKSSKAMSRKLQNIKDNKKKSRPTKNSSSPFGLRTAFEKSSMISARESYESLAENSSSRSLSKNSISKKKSTTSK